MLRLPLTGRGGRGGRVGAGRACGLVGASVPVASSGRAQDRFQLVAMPNARAAASTPQLATLCYPGTSDHENTSCSLVSSDVHMADLGQRAIGRLDLGRSRNVVHSQQLCSAVVWDMDVRIDCCRANRKPTKSAMPVLQSTAASSAARAAWHALRRGTAMTSAAHAILKCYSLAALTIVVDNSARQNEGSGAGGPPVPATLLRRRLPRRRRSWPDAAPLRPPCTCQCLNGTHLAEKVSLAALCHVEPTLAGTSGGARRRRQAAAARAEHDQRRLGSQGFISAFVTSPSL